MTVEDPEQEVITSQYKSSIRPLTAEEYIEIMASHGVELRISDGTSEGTWRFWMDGERLFYRRLVWTQNKQADPDFLQMVLDDDGTTQLVAGDSDG